MDEGKVKGCTKSSMGVGRTNTSKPVGEKKKRLSKGKGSKQGREIVLYVL